MRATIMFLAALLVTPHIPGPFGTHIAHAESSCAQGTGTSSRACSIYPDEEETPAESGSTTSTAADTGRNSSDGGNNDGGGNGRSDSSGNGNGSADTGADSSTATGSTDSGGSSGANTGSNTGTSGTPSSQCPKTARITQTPDGDIVDSVLLCDPVSADTGPAVFPVQAARSAMAALPLEAITIGMAPEPSPDWGYRRGYVGFHIWMWVPEETMTPATWGPLKSSLSLNGQEITVRAHVDHINWDMGDGTTITCGKGTAFRDHMGRAPSPDCGHLYEKNSKDQPNGFYTITATSHWHVHWHSTTGHSGILTTTTDTSTPLEIQELHAINLSPPSTPGT